MTNSLDKKNKGGRPPAPPNLQRVVAPVRLPRWMLKWIDAQKPKTRTEVIESSVMKANKLKAPKEK